MEGLKHRFIPYVRMCLMQRFLMVWRISLKLVALNCSTASPIVICQTHLERWLKFRRFSLFRKYNCLKLQQLLRYLSLAIVTLAGKTQLQQGKASFLRRKGVTPTSCAQVLPEIQLRVRLSRGPLPQSYTSVPGHVHQVPA